MSIFLPIFYQKIHLVGVDEAVDLGPGLHHELQRLPDRGGVVAVGQEGLERLQQRGFVLEPSRV